MDLCLGLLASYLLGSIPFALLIVRGLAGVDLRQIGSGNVGATNAARAFGKRARYLVFLMVYLLDFGKGLVASYYLTEWFGFAGQPDYQVYFGAAAILGHCTSPFLGFRGGKGVATLTGVAFVLAPLVLAIGIATFFVVLGATRQVFLGSLALGSALATGVILQDPAGAFTGERLPVTVFFLVLFLFLIYTHRSNIQKFFGRTKTE